jgi:AraC family transcriptional regulator
MIEFDAARVTFVNTEQRSRAAQRIKNRTSPRSLRAYGTSERSPIPHRGGLAPRQMRRVLDYIDAHLTDELGLVELAAIAGLSPHHFGEAFKTSMGTSPHRYVIEGRVQHALELLREKDRSIGEIAHAAGFSSQSHLTANFRRVTGLTPGRFRRSLG